MNKKYIISFFLFSIFCSIASTAQTWQWGKLGGSPTSSTNNFEENVLDITTDKWGNVYAVGLSYSPGMNVDGHNLTSYGDMDIVVTSFKCDGTYRWSKVIGSSLPDATAPSIKTDTLGGVYLAFSVTAFGQTGYIDNDTSVGSSFKRIYLVKYDTAGVYKWLRMPQDTAGVSNVSWPLDMDVDQVGNIDLFCSLFPGSYANGAFIANDTGLYVLHYNAQGGFTGSTQLAMEISGTRLSYIRMKCDYMSGRYYFAGAAGLVFAGTSIFNNMPFNNSQYVTAYNSQGQFIWLSSDNGTLNSFFGRPAIDDSGNVYVTGYGRTGDSFNGDIYTSTYTSGPMIASLDSNGNNRWIQYALTNGSTRGYGVALRNNNEVVITGAYPGKVEWPGYAGPHPNHTINQGYDVFMTSFNSHTGIVNKVDTIGGVFGGLDEPTSIVADRMGSIYIGGRFGGSLYVGNADTLQLMGGQSDFFIAKYGNQCNCALPLVSFTYGIVNNVVSFTYTGSSQYDSLKWNFGDGGNSTLPNPSHTYTAQGNYNVCLTVYNSCGSETYCANVQTTVGVNTIAGLTDISVYPNPVTEMLQVKGLLETSHYRLLNITGEVMQQGILNPNNKGISTSELAPGMYLLELNNKQQQGVVRVMKQ